jgi:hypothetical protein
VNGTFWTTAYTYIYYANAIIEGVNKSTGITTAAKERYIGEAKFIRAFTHFYLVNLYGDVPLITSTDYELNAQIGRTSSESVYKQIIADLTDAFELLKTAYVTTAAYPTARVRPNKWAVAALLARVYLYQRNWQQAETFASAVIGATDYTLETDLNNVFLGASKEAIWQLLPVIDVVNTSEGNSFVPSNSLFAPNYKLTDTLIKTFEPGDQRKVAWTKTATVSGTPYTYPVKYKVRINTTPPTPPKEYNMVLRLAEQYLIRAEARAKQNNVVDAKSDLNVIRKRALLGDTPANDSASVLKAIAAERKIEFFAEWGHRWFDLKRTGKADEILSIIKGNNWQSTDVLYPIPSTQILKNNKLTQNQGYN